MWNEASGLVSAPPTRLHLSTPAAAAVGRLHLLYTHDPVVNWARRHPESARRKQDAAAGGGANTRQRRHPLPLARRARCGRRPQLASKSQQAEFCTRVML